MDLNCKSSSIFDSAFNRFPLISSFSNILDLPDEMLVELILYLNARERLSLGHSCKRFNRLVFQEKRTLRDLDFSKEGYLTSMSEVHQYFNDKSKYAHIRRVNVSNIYCTRPAQLLQHIGKAKDLVEVNMIGFKFKDAEQLASFLQPLQRLKRLSINWPIVPIDDSVCCRILKGPFSALTYLKLMCDVQYMKTLIEVLELCRELEELRLFQRNEYLKSRGGVLVRPGLKKLNKLRVAACCGSDTKFLRDIIVHMIPDPEEWTMFQSYEAVKTPYFYCEKNPEVSPELRANVLRDVDPPNQSLLKVRSSLLFESLLQEVIQITNDTASKDFCCLSGSSNQYSCLLTIKDTRLLLKNPRHKISYLYLNHNIEPECDVHLLASAFPSLTKLVLSNIIKSKASLLTKADFDVTTGLKRKRVALEGGNEQMDQNSSFKKLVENTPDLKDLTLCARKLRQNESWDLAALYLIAGWERLTSLYLADLPIRSGHFLFEIGKHCPNLQKLRLESLGPRAACCYAKELSQMFAHTRNLKDFSIQQNNFGQVSHLFTQLAGCLKLRRVRVKSLGSGNSVDNLLFTILSLARSSTLISLICEIEGMTQTACDKLKSSLQRLKNESARSNFQFEIIRWIGADTSPHNFALHYVHKDLVLPHCFNDCLDRLD